MRTTLAALAAAATLSASTAVSAQTAPSPDASLDDLYWIAGHWTGDAFGGEIDEAWLGASGAAMTGVFRLVQDGKAVMYELLLLEQDDDGEIYYRFKHVGRGWEPWEETRLEYRLTELDGRKATFRPTGDQPVQNAPGWFTYESPSDDRLVVTIHGGQTPIALQMTRR
ncbi:MAG: DUF6265 family protein [Gemmatimonadota bacterium]|nr:DUF6265 family protein [Gemmatimonadota bacterium]